MNDIFNSTLSEFISDFAWGDAIRHLAREGMTINQIVEKHYYPVSKSYIQSTVWKYYISSGTIKLENLSADLNDTVRVKYVVDRSPYGKSSYRRVEEKVSAGERKYYSCDFGKCLYKEYSKVMKALEGLSPDDRKYILDLPWPIDRVYHVKNARMDRIYQEVVINNKYPVMEVM